jgi:hypothetical protein
MTAARGEFQRLRPDRAGDRRTGGVKHPGPGPLYSVTQIGPFVWERPAPSGVQFNARVWQLWKQACPVLWLNPAMARTNRS